MSFSSDLLDSRSVRRRRARCSVRKGEKKRKQIAALVPVRSRHTGRYSPTITKIQKIRETTLYVIKNGSLMTASPPHVESRGSLSLSSSRRGGSTAAVKQIMNPQHAPGGPGRGGSVKTNSILFLLVIQIRLVQMSSPNSIQIRVRILILFQFKLT